MHAAAGHETSLGVLRHVVDGIRSCGNQPYVRWPAGGERSGVQYVGDPMSIAAASRLCVYGTRFGIDGIVSYQSTDFDMACERITA